MDGARKIFDTAAEGEGAAWGGVREVAAPFVVPGPSGWRSGPGCVRVEIDAAVLTEVGVFLGTLAAGGISRLRSRQGLEHDRGDLGGAQAGADRDLIGAVGGQYHQGHT